MDHELIAIFYISLTYLYADMSWSGNSNKYWIDGISITATISDWHRAIIYPVVQFWLQPANWFSAQATLDGKSWIISWWFGV